MSSVSTTTNKVTLSTMKTLKEKLSELTHRDLIKLSKELQQTTVAPDALIREVIKGTEFDTTAPILAFVAVGQLLAFELTYRFEEVINLIGEY